MIAKLKDRLITPAGLALFVAILGICSLWGQWRCTAFTRDILLWASWESRPRHEGNVVFITVGDNDLEYFKATDGRILDRKIYARAVDKLTQQLGHAPTISEITVATGFAEEEVYDTFEVGKCGRPLSLDALYSGDGNEEGLTLLDCLGSEDPEFKGLADRMDLTTAFRCLTPTERTIIKLKFFAGLAQTQIAGRLGISQMHVSRLQRTALRKLKLTLLQ